MRIRVEGADGGRVIVVELAEGETSALRALLDQYLDVVSGSGADPALDRLFPAAYRDDPDAAAEFAQYTRAGLLGRKTENAGRVALALADPVIRLDPEEAGRWLPVLTDLRLVIAERLGIRADDDPVPDTPAGEVYVWLANLQALLIAAIDPEASWYSS